MLYMLGQQSVQLYLAYSKDYVFYIKPIYNDYIIIIIPKPSIFFAISHDDWVEWILNKYYL